MFHSGIFSESICLKYRNYALRVNQVEKKKCRTYPPSDVNKIRGLAPPYNFVKSDSTLVLYENLRLSIGLIFKTQEVCTGGPSTRVHDVYVLACLNGHMLYDATRHIGNR